MYLSPIPKFKAFVPGTSTPAVGYKLYSYDAGTTTPRATGKDQAGTANTNPIILDANGECDLWLGDYSYKFQLKTDLDSLVWTVDNVQSLSSLVNNSTPSVASVAVLRTTVPLYVGQQFNLLGHTVAGVGGGVFYYAGVVANASSDDNGTIIVSFVGGTYYQFKRIYDGYAVDVTWFGIVPAISGTPTDTTTQQQAIWDSTNWKAVYYPSGRYAATKLTQKNSTREKIWGDQALIIGVASSTTSCLFELKTGNGFHISGIKFSGAQNTNYTCGMHWYTNDLNTYYPGKASLDIEFTEFVLGVNVGMLASQSTYYAQGTVQANGIATDAPLSECSVRLKIQDCPSGFRICQPNGKLTITDSYIAAEGSGWAVPTSTSTWTAIELERFGEVSIIGGSLEAVSTSAGTFIKQNSGNLYIEGALLEAASKCRISSTNATSFFNLRISKILNLGYNSTTQPLFLIKSDAVGTIDVVNSWLAFPYGNLSGGTAVLSKGVSNLTTEAYAEAPNVLITLSDVELRDCAEPTASPWRMSNIGVKFKYNNVRLTSFTDVGLENSPRVKDTKLSNSTVNLLASIVDQSCSTITASPVTTPTTTGGWTFTSGGGVYAYGRVTPAATLNLETLNGVAQTPTYALRMQANALVGLTAESPSFNCEPFSYVLVTGWIYVAAGGAVNVGVKLNSRDFADANISTANMAYGNASLLQAGWQPFSCWAQQVATGSKARIQLYVENGADIQWFGISAYVDK